VVLAVVDRIIEDAAAVEEVVGVEVEVDEEGEEEVSMLMQRVFLAAAAAW
jgi:hypothetical protein